MAISDADLVDRLCSLDRQAFQNLVNLVNNGFQSVDRDETLSAAGNADPFARVTKLSIAAADFAVTLPNGTYKGQPKTIQVLSSAGTNKVTLTVTTATGSEPTSYVLDTAGQSIFWVWDGSGWHIMDRALAGSKAITMGTTVINASDMYASYVLSVDGTKNTALPDGLVPGEMRHFSVASATNTPVGALNAAHFADKTGVAKVAAGAIGATTAFLWVRWDGAKHREVNSTGITFS